MQNKRETKQTFVVIKGMVGIPDGDGNVSDILPFKRIASGNNKGQIKRDANGNCEWVYTTIEAFPSKVGYMVVSGKLCPAEEFQKFYPELYEKAVDDGDLESQSEDGENGGENQ